MLTAPSLPHLGELLTPFLGFHNKTVLLKYLNKLFLSFNSRIPSKAIIYI